MTLLLGLQFRRVSSLVVFTWVGFERTLDLEIRNQTEYNGYFLFQKSNSDTHVLKRASDLSQIIS